MAIYRGPGGSGDAVNDSSSETTLAVLARDAAIAAQAAAEAAQAAAETAEANAELAETNAETAETNAETAEANAETAQAAAEAAQAAAETAQAAAELAETNAETAETNAETAATNAASSASSASTSASNAATSATNASNSATAAATSATNASNSATAAASSASSAATSATNAANSATAAQTAETNAETAETNAETAQAAAELAETNAETAATNAASSASAAATSASNAASSASAASTSASNAASSASAASSSATSAASSASSSQAAADAALAALDSFDDRYLGQKSTAPTVDNDGNALVTGALYFDTVSNAMKVWDGSSWLSAYASLSGALLATNNLSDLTSASTARTNLGLGTAATTAATDYATAAQGAKADTALQSADIGVTVQGYDADTAKLDVVQSWTAAQTFNEGITLDTSNLVFSGTGNRITGDMSNATIANRLAFQTSTTNSVTVVTAIPNGTGTQANFNVHNTSDPSNASDFRFLINATEARIQSALTGTGSFLPITMYTSGSERLRIDTSGNVGIGTSSPTQKLDVAGSGATRFVIRDTSSTGIARLIASGTDAYVGNASATGTFNIQTNSNNIATFDVAGNLGLGVTPSAWTSYKALQVNEASLAATTSSNTVLSSNAYYDGSWKYIYSNYASRYLMLSGVHSWHTAPSGTAGNAITFTQAMTLNASGNLGIGTTSPSSRLAVNGGTSTSQIRWEVNNASYTQEVSTNAAANAYVYKSNDASYHIWKLSNSEAMRLDSSGNLGIGTTSPGGKLDVAGVFKIQTNGDVYGATGNAGAIMLCGGGAYDAGGSIKLFGSSNNNMITFQTGSYTERMRIDSNGNVGIGTGSPASYSNQKTLALSGAWGGRYDNVFGSTVNSTWYADSSQNNYFGTVTNYPQIFITNNTERMRIDSSGNVGIGTSSPSNKLQINGTAGVVRNGADAYFYIQETSSQSYSQALILADSTTSWFVANRYAGSGAGVSGFGIGTTNSADMLQIDTSANLYFNSGYGSAAVAYGCRAWVNFNGTGTVAIRASGNVSSITDNGTGDYTVNFTNAMPDANYSASGFAGDSTGNNFYVHGVAYSTGSLRINIKVGGTSYDSAITCVSIFR